MSKIEQRLGNKEQMDNDPRGGWREKRGRGKQRDTNRGLMGMDNGVGLTVGVGESEG